MPRDGWVPAILDTDSVIQALRCCEDRTLSRDTIEMIDIVPRLLIIVFKAKQAKAKKAKAKAKANRICESSM